jgi:hypothetical protein
MFGTLFLNVPTTIEDMLLSSQGPCCVKPMTFNLLKVTGIMYEVCKDLDSGIFPNGNVKFSSPDDHIPTLLRLCNLNMRQKREERHNPTIQVFKMVILPKLTTASFLLKRGCKDLFIRLESDSSQ